MATLPDFSWQECKRCWVVLSVGAEGLSICVITKSVLSMGAEGLSICVITRSVLSVGAEGLIA
jgi:hypothetical protein